jgi:hypothetical protein
MGGASERASLVSCVCVSVQLDRSFRPILQVTQVLDSLSLSLSAPFML